MTEKLPSNYDIYTPEEDLKKLKIEINKGNIIHLPWNPKVGTIIFIKQIHLTPHVTPENPLYKQILLNQKKIYNSLQEMQPKDIFIEWVTDEYILPNGDSSPLRKMFDDIIRSSDNWREIVLQKWGWAFLYILENPDVKIHITESSDIRDEISINYPNNVPPEMDEKREQFTIEAVKEFLDRNPWKKAVVVYGFLHNFEDNIRSLYPSNPPARAIMNFHTLTLPRKKK